MIPIAGLFETHLTIEDLQRSIDFYKNVLRLPLANPDLGILLWTSLQQRTGSAGELVKGSRPAGGFL